MLNRREFICLSAAAASIAVESPFLRAANKDSVAAIDFYFLEILDGSLRNARKTSDSLAVCDFPQGYPRMVINALGKPLTAERTTLVSLHYASPRQLKINELVRRASRLVTV